MRVYNLFPLLAGPFLRWNEHFCRAAELGFDWIFVNPVQQPGMSGSLYAIRDYFQFHPLLLDPASVAGPEEQVRQMRDQARTAGLKIMIDLVVNHCAVDSPLIGEHPLWFAWEADGRVAHPSCYHNGQHIVWGDLARFDHRGTRDPEGLYRYCLRVVEHLLRIGFDGFRCDAAYQIAASFWRRLIRDVKAKHPQVVFVAETLGCTPEQTKTTARAGFDYIFNSVKWWDFSNPWLIEQYNLVRETVPSISFPESHDTPRLCEELAGNIAGMKQRYLFTALFSAGVMMPMGFEFGSRKPLHVVDTRPGDWQRDGIDLCPFIRQVNALKRAQRVFCEESAMDLLPCGNPHVLLMRKVAIHGGQRALLILNKDICRHQEFYADHFRDLIGPGRALRDASPEHARDRVPEPFHYGLRPGQGIVLVQG
ncbi:MAG: alpha-amylase family glycosyl hydrolase [Thermoguttaceae bacterium]|jgi:starch synthase (maltosyl-transferring)